MAKSKWGHLKATLPTLPVDPKYADVVETFRKVYVGVETIGLLAGDYEALRDRIDKLEAQLESAGAERVALEQVITERLEAQGLASASTARHRFTPQVEPYPNVTDRAALRAWVDATMPDALQLPWQTLKSATKELLESGQTPPPGIDLFVKTSLRRQKVGD